MGSEWAFKNESLGKTWLVLKISSSYLSCLEVSHFLFFFPSRGLEFSYKMARIISRQSSKSRFCLKFGWSFVILVLLSIFLNSVTIVN